MDIFSPLCARLLLPSQQTILHPELRFYIHCKVQCFRCSLHVQSRMQHLLFMLVFRNRNKCHFSPEHFNNQHFQAICFLRQQGKQKLRAPFSLLACFWRLMQWHSLYSLTQTTLGESLPACRRWLGHIRKSPAGLDPARGWMPPLLLSTNSTRLGQQHHLSVHTSEELPPPLARGSPSSVENFWMEKCLAHFRDRMDCSSCLL